MPYATKQDLLDRFGQAQIIEISDKAGAGSIDDTVVTRALGDAEATIDSYLGGRYMLPLTSVPDRLKIAACDIARYQMYERDATEEVTTRYKDQIRWLELVAQGKVSLGLDAADQVTATPFVPELSGPDRVFSDTTLSDFVGGL
jgi:phage gp36-like protein